MVGFFFFYMFSMCLYYNNYIIMKMLYDFFVRNIKLVVCNNSDIKMIHFSSMCPCVLVAVISDGASRRRPCV